MLTQLNATMASIFCSHKDFSTYSFTSWVYTLYSKGNVFLSKYLIFCCILHIISYVNTSLD